MGDKLRLVTAANEFGDKLDWVKQVIERTNEGIDEYNREAEARAAQIEEQMKRQILEEERASAEMIRDTIRRRLGSY